MGRAVPALVSTGCERLADAQAAVYLLCDPRPPGCPVQVGTLDYEGLVALAAACDRSVSWP